MKDEKNQIIFSFHSSSFWKWRCSRRRGSFAGANILRPAARVFLRCQLLEFGFAAMDGLAMNLLEKGNTPPTTGSRAAAFGKLASDLGLVHTHKIDELPPSHVEAITNL